MTFPTDSPAGVGGSPCLNPRLTMLVAMASPHLPHPAHVPLVQAFAVRVLPVDVSQIEAVVGLVQFDVGQVFRHLRRHGLEHLVVHPGHGLRDLDLVASRWRRREQLHTPPPSTFTPAVAIAAASSSAFAPANLLMYASCPAVSIARRQCPSRTVLIAVSASIPDATSNAANAVPVLPWPPMQQTQVWAGSSSRSRSHHRTPT